MPEGSPEQESVTDPLNAPAPETTRETGALSVPGATFTEAGVGADKAEMTTCKLTAPLLRDLGRIGPDRLQLERRDLPPPPPALIMTPILEEGADPDTGFAEQA